MKTLKEKIEVMQAALDGKEIEFFDLVKWVKPVDGKNLSFNWQDFDYRIKPEPMEFWVNVSLDGAVISHVFPSKEVALSAWKNSNTPFRTVRFREVTDD